ncbi:MAG: site-specific DNA-methyltransferase [Bacteroidetes bacterium]|nr:site-specific DNA-methyltransferase [Bacteroidota bacterium]
MQPHPAQIAPTVSSFQSSNQTSHKSRIEEGIYVADAIDIMKSLPSCSVDLLLTDIPYGHVSRSSGGLRNLDKGFADDETFDLSLFADQAQRVVTGSGVIFCGKEQFSELFAFFSLQCSVRMLIWEKTNPMPMNGQYLFLSGVECAVYFRKSGAPFNGHCLNTVFRYPNGSSKRHPTEKPLPLFKEFVSLLTNENGLVLDPCVGSGTTAVACKELGRRCIASDIDKESINITMQRLK